MNKRFFPRIDLPLLMAIIPIMLLSSLTLWSASGFDESMLFKHLARCALTLVCILVMSSIPAASYQRSAPYLYFVAVSLLLAVALFGDSTNGSQRWLDIGFFRFQPSELIKLSIPIMIAWMLHLEGGRPDFRKIALCLMITLVPAVDRSATRSGWCDLYRDLRTIRVIFRGYELENHWWICGERSNARTNSVVFRDGSLPKKPCDSVLTPRI